jgi:AraC family transcriptional regulator
LYLGTMYQKISAEQYKGKVIRLSAIFKTEQVSSRAGIWVRIEDANSSVVGFDNMDNQPLSGDQPWRRYSVILDVPQNADTIAFGSLIIGTGTMWFDSFKLESLGESQATPKHRNLFPENLGLEKLDE